MTDRKNLYIPSVDAKDLYIANNFIKKEKKGYRLTKENGEINLRRFINSFDYSLDLIELRDVAASVYEGTRSVLSFWKQDKEYSDKIINVTFKYSVKEFNRITKDLYVRSGYNIKESDLIDNRLIEDGKLVAIKTNAECFSEIDPDILPKYFSCTFDCISERYTYTAPSSIPTLITRRELREYIYKNGFICNGIHYRRFKRSSGSARVGKCLFIDERLYPAMHESEKCGLTYKEGDEIDIAALEAYIALTSSSIIDTIELSPKNILVIDDYESIFDDDAIYTETDEDNHLITTEKRTTMKNSIWDGQSLIDRSAMGKYSEKGCLLLRNKFFKSCCFNTNIQLFFEDNNITDVSQLNGTTLATDISQIKLITTPSSIKYYKFGDFETWAKNIYPYFGIVKYEKNTHFFDGRMVQAHYQLINTLQLSPEQISELVHDELDYLNSLNQDPTMMRFHLGIELSDRNQDNIMKTKSEIVYKMLQYDCGFEKTRIYQDFKHDFIEAYKKNMKKGHILLNGTYATLCGNPYEMLKQSIGKFNGESSLEVGSICCKRFAWDIDLLGSRSPHVTIGNILIAKNRRSLEIERYMNATNNIVYLNSINENILERLSGADYDSDTCLLTDNKIVVNSALKNYYVFKVPTKNVHAPKTNRKYDMENLADLDFKTGTNKIGEIVNLSQELNSVLWDKVWASKKSASECYDDIKDIYYDVCQLDVMSNIEIDKAKKEIKVNNGTELNMLRDKYNEELMYYEDKKIKPKFLGFIAKTKGYYDPEHKYYKDQRTAMDYLYKEITRFKSSRVAKTQQLKISDILKPQNFSSESVKWNQIKKIIDMTTQCRNRLIAIQSRKGIDAEERVALGNIEKELLASSINEIRINKDTMYQLLKNLDYEKNSFINSLLLSVLFSYHNLAIFQMMNDLPEATEELVVIRDGEIDVFGEKYAKIGRF